MSGLLNHISKDFEHRLAVRRGMLAHFGLDLSDEETIRLRSDIRETLIACSRCGNPDVCEGWVDQDRPGMPMFCRARDAFLRLQATAREARSVRRRA